LELKRKRIEKPKFSKPTVSPKLLHALEKVKDGGSISYIFLTERTRFSKEFPLGETYQHKSVLHCAIKPEMFYKMVDGKKVRRSMAEILQVFDDTKWDNGASYYIIG
jgi:hypothetical protein